MQPHYIVQDAEPHWLPLSESDVGKKPITEAQLLQLASELGNSLVQHQAQQALYGQWDKQNIYVHEGHCYLIDRTPSEPSFLTAFEQLANDPSWPVGGAVDVYGLGMLLRYLLTKETLPLASARWLEDLTPLTGGGIEHIRPRLLRAIDLATELTPTLRLSSVQELLLYMDISLEETQAHVPAVVATNVQIESATEADSLPSAPVATTRSEPLRASRQTPWLYALCAGLCLVVVVLLYSLWSNDEKPTAAAEVTLDDTTEGEERNALALVAEPVEPHVMANAERPDEDHWGDDQRDEPSVMSSVSVLDPVENDEPNTFSAEAEETIETGSIDNTLHVENEMSPLVEAPEEPAETVQAVPTAPRSASEPSANEARATVEVQLAIFPWGDVYVNNQRRGASPPLKTLSLRPGSYQIQVRNGNLPPYTTSLEVTEESELTIRHRF